MRDKVEFLGLPFDNLTMNEALDQIEQFVRERRPRKIFTPNVALLIWSRSDPFLREVYRSSDLLTVDGMAIFYALRLLGTPVQESLSASLLFFPLLDLARRKGYGVYMVGATEEVLRQAVENITRQYDGIRILGWHNGYFDLNNPAQLIDDITGKRPDILLVGMSSPLKERFVERHLAAMNVPVSIGVGGMFDIAAGHATFAPDWIRKLCLEWFYRLIQEPRRMWKRYLTTNSVFVALVLREFVRRLVLARMVPDRCSQLNERRSH